MDIKTVKSYRIYCINFSFSGRDEEDVSLEQSLFTGTQDELNARIKQLEQMGYEEVEAEPVIPTFNYSKGVRQDERQEMEYKNQ